jgi:hypothetical protein
MSGVSKPIRIDPAFDDPEVMKRGGSGGHPDNAPGGDQWQIVLANKLSSSEVVWRD